MIFSIEDGRKEFFQWDLNRRLIISDNTVTEVHFCNKTDDCSLCVEVYEENGTHFADVPNILLQNDWRINVYAYDSEYTKHYAVYKVNKRTKPADYVYTETELKTWEELAAQTGYYTPFVDATGFLTWKASKETLPDVEGANIKGAKGDSYILTDADKTEIVQMTLSALPNGDGVSY